VDGDRLRTRLLRKAARLPKVADDLRVAICAREAVTNAQGILAVTAADVFSG